MIYTYIRICDKKWADRNNLRSAHIVFNRYGCFMVLNPDLCNEMVNMLMNNKATRKDRRVHISDPVRRRGSIYLSALESSDERKWLICSQQNVVTTKGTNSRNQIR